MCLLEYQFVNQFERDDDVYEERDDFYEEQGEKDTGEVYFIFRFLDSVLLFFSCIQCEL
jgi:hypothetical protein